MSNENPLLDALDMLIPGGKAEAKETEEITVTGTSMIEAGVRTVNAETIAKPIETPATPAAIGIIPDGHHVVVLSPDALDCVLNSFDAQKLRIGKFIAEAKKKKAVKEVSEWQKLQAAADAVAADIRNQTGRAAPGNTTKGEDK